VSSLWLKEEKRSFLVYQDTDQLLVAFLKNIEFSFQRVKLSLTSASANIS
jgi:hypothetical protein